MKQATKSAPLVYLVILNYNGARITLDCVRSALKIDYPNFKILVVDNASADDSVKQLRAHFSDGQIELLVNDKNEGYAGGNNRGIEKALAAGADYIFILNNDTIVNQGCLTPLVQAMEYDPKLGIAGCPIIDGGSPAVTRYRRRVNLFTGQTTWGDGVHAGALGDLDYISGAALLVRADTFRRVGMFDSRFFLECEDIDLSFRVHRAGYKVSLVPSTGVLHMGGQTINSFRPTLLFCYVRNRAWVVRRYGSIMHWVAFNLFSFCYWYPRVILGRLIRKEYDCIVPVFRGIWKGHRGYPGSDPLVPESRVCPERGEGEQNNGQSC